MVSNFLPRFCSPSRFRRFNQGKRKKSKAFLLCHLAPAQAPKIEMGLVARRLPCFAASFAARRPLPKPEGRGQCRIFFYKFPLAFGMSFPRFCSGHTRAASRHLASRNARKGQASSLQSEKGKIKKVSLCCIFPDVDYTTKRQIVKG